MSWNTRANCFWIIIENLGNGSVYGQILNESWEILPVERNFREPLWFKRCCLTRASLYTHITETKTMFSNGRKTQSLRLQQFTCTISKFRNRAMAIRCKPSSLQSSQRWVEPNQRSVPNQCSNIRVFLDPIHQGMQNSTDHTIQNHVCRQGGIFTSGALESLSSLTGQQMKKSAGRLSSPGLPDLLFWRQISQTWLFLQTVGVKNLFVFFSIQYMAFWRQLAHAVRLVSSLFKYLAEKCY